MNKVRIRETVTADQVNSKNPGLDSKLVALAQKTCEQYKNTLDKKAYTHLYMNVLNKLRSRAVGEITSEAEAQDITKKYADALSAGPQPQDQSQEQTNQSQDQIEQPQDQTENNTEENKEEGGEDNNNFTRAGISSEEAASIQRKLINGVLNKNAKLFSNEIKNLEGYKDGGWSVNFGLANLNSKTRESLNSRSLESFKEDKKSKDYVSTEIAFNVFLDKKTAKNNKAAADDKSSKQSEEESDEGKPEEADQKDTQTETAQDSTPVETSEKKEEALLRAEAFLRRFEEAEENAAEEDQPTTETMKNALEKIREIIINSLNEKGGDAGLKISTEKETYWLIFEKGKYLSAISPTEGYFSLILRARTKNSANKDSGLKAFGKGLLNWVANA